MTQPTQRTSCSAPDARCRRTIVLAALLAAVLVPLPVLATDGATGPIERGDAAWERRAEGSRGDRAAAAPIGEAVAAYEEALAADPGALDASWRLLRALYFQGDYAAVDSEAKARTYDRGKEACAAAVDRLAREVEGFDGVKDADTFDLRRRLGDRPGAVELFFWCAVDWGLWGENHGKLAAAREGVAPKVRDYAQAAVALDDRYEHGGGHRVLGRLHSEAPNIPFITGWISRETAIVELRKALAIGPDDPINRIFLAEALLDHGDDAHEREAWRILEELARLEPRPERRVEDHRVLRLVHEHLERRGG